MRIGLLSLNETGFPDIVTQIVKGSLPSCSVLKPWVSVTGPGKVTGRGSLQVILEHVTVAPVIVLEFVSKSQTMFG